VASGLEATSRRLATACNDEDVDVQALVWEAMEVAQRSVEAVREAVGALGARQIGDAGPEAWSELADLMAHVELDVMDIYGRASAFDRSHGREQWLSLQGETLSECSTAFVEDEGGEISDADSWREEALNHGGAAS